MPNSTLGQRPRRMSLEELVDYILENATRDSHGCLISHFSCNEQGRAQCGFQGRMRKAHQLVIERFQGPRPAGMETLHTCERGTHGCVDPDHLKYGTPSENKMRLFSSTGHNRAFTYEQACAIREELETSGISKSALARRLGVTKTCIYLIATHQTYRFPDMENVPKT